MRRRVLLGALGVMGTAGCLRLEGDSSADTRSGDRNATETESRAESTTNGIDTERSETVESTERPEEVAYPTGLSEDGVDSFLFSSHTRALQAESFRTSWEKLNRTQNVIPVKRSYEVDAGVAVGEWTRQDGGLVSMFRNGNSGHWREDLGDRYTYGKTDSGFNWRKLAWRVEVLPQLEAWDWRPPERANEQRPAVWELTATEVGDSSAAPGYHDGSVTALEDASLRVDEDGVVRELSSTYTYEESGAAGETLTYSTRYSVDALGSVDVREPSWVSTAREEFPQVRAGFTDDRRFVEFRIEDGSRFESGTSVVIYPESRSEGRFLVEPEEPVETGETVYVWQDESAPSYQNARLSRGSRPGDVSPPRFEGAHKLTARRRTSKYFPGVDIE